MTRIVLMMLVAVGCALVAACGDGNTPKKVEIVPFSGAPDRSTIEMADTSEARAVIGSIQNQLKALLLSKYEGNVDKLAEGLRGPMTAEKAQMLGVQFDTKYYKLSDYSMDYLGGGRFKVIVAPGTRLEVNQEISAK